MAVSRDTTADDAAALHTAPPVPGANDPPLTLSGARAAQLREVLLDTHGLLTTLEEQTKEYGLRKRIRIQRVLVGQQLATVARKRG